MQGNIEILAIGNPLVDIFIEIDKTIADKYGINDSAQHIDREQAEILLNDESINFSKAIKCSGGGAANVAKIAAMLGMKTTFTGCAGRDNLAEIFANDLGEAGAGTILVETDKKTGICFACKINNELRFAASPGAALEFNEDNISEELITSAEVVAVDGYILDRRPLIQYILLKASRHGIPVALDAGSVFQVKNKAEEILTYSRNFPLFIFMNSDEVIAFYNTIRKTKDEYLFSTEKEKEVFILNDVCPMLKIITNDELFPIIVVKLGGRGSLVAAGGNIYREETFTITPKDAVGAGDAYCAAFLSGWIRNKSVAECAALGNKVARKILEVPGTHIKSVKLKSFRKMLKN